MIEKIVSYAFYGVVVEKLKLSSKQSIEIYNNHSDKEFLLNHYSLKKSNFSVPQKA